MWNELWSKWLLRSEKHDYQNNLLPPPALQDTVLLYRQIDLIVALEQIDFQHEFLMQQMETEDWITACDENRPYYGRYNPNNRPPQTPYEHIYVLLGVEPKDASKKVGLSFCDPLDLPDDCMFHGELLGRGVE